MIQAGGGVQQDVRDQRRNFLIERTQIALWVVLGATIVFGLADIVLAPQDLALLWSGKVTVIVLLTLALRAFRAERVRPWSVPLAVMSTALAYVVVASAGLINEQLEVSMLLCAVTALALAAALPWGVAVQLVHVALAVAAILVDAAAIPGGADLIFGYPGVTAAILFAASLYLAYETQRETQNQAETFVNLRKQDNRLRLLVQQMPAALWSTDRELCVTSMSGAALPPLGISLDQGRKVPLAEYLGNDDPEFPPLQAHRAALRGESRSYELEWQERTFSAHVEPFRSADGSIAGTLGVALDRTELKEAQEYSATLLEIARDISGTLDRQQILDRVARRAARSLTCDVLLVFYWNEERRRYRVISHHGLPAEWADGVAALEFGQESPIVRHLRDHQSAIIDEPVAQNLISASLLERLEIAALAATQLRVRDRGLGALLALRLKGRSAFTPGQRELLEGIARHVAIALEVAELHSSVKREGEISAALARVGGELMGAHDPHDLMRRFSRLTAEVLDCGFSITFLHDPRDLAYVATAAHGLTDEQWEVVRAIRLPQATLAPLLDRLEANEVVQLFPTKDKPGRSLEGLASRYKLNPTLYVGLRRGNRLIGYQVAHARTGGGFDRQQVDILRGIGGLASLALENASLMQELARANSIKSDFVATMSHELRTPLNAIIGYNLLMRDGEFGHLSPEQSKVCDYIERSSRTLLDLISATLDVSRLDAGAVAVNLAEVAVAPLFESIRGEITSPKSSAVRLEWDLVEPLPMLCTDQLKLKVIVKNLIENALKFTDAGFVRVTVQGKDGGIEIKVSDSGIGIPPEAQSAIFEAFRQVDGSSTRRHGGVGLGLYIVHRLLEMLGGTIDLVSAPNQGATFSVWIPSRPGRTDTPLMAAAS
jgi:signal transduction histidine kinase/PAS domain-containing protein